ncbi:hypothetical protein [Kribbella sp. NPDC051770]|uniref:hypothetical protein n=1 Tax=Kribbella sp. NPDC051770 TaxID=3155413 RepID=UPI003447401E
MLKRTLGLALLLTAPVAVPAPADAAGTGIGPVTIAWSDATHTKVRITWTETTPVANTVTVGSTALGTTTAAQANELVVAATSFPRTVAGTSHRVKVAGSDGTSAESVAFDSYVYEPGFQTLTTSFPAYNQLRWTLPADTATDSTPNDPLDLPGTTSYLVTQGFDPDPDEWWSSFCAETTTTSPARTGVLPNSGHPFTLEVAPKNEWGVSRGGREDVGTIADVQVTAPGATPYGGTTTLTGHVDQRGMVISGSPPTCDEHRYEAYGTTLFVHQRPSAAAPWTAVGTTKTGADGNYQAVFRNPGYREYRVVVASGAAEGIAPRFGADSQTVAVRSTTRVVSAKFIQPTVNLGTQPQAYLWVDPAGSQKAALQFKNASGAWQGVSYKTLYAGRGLLTFPWNKRGVTQFRWVVPASPGVDAAYSSTFSLTVR